MKLGVMGAGAFGAALAVTWGRERSVVLWGRRLQSRTIVRLPGVALPEGVVATDDPAMLADCDTVVLALPTQALASVLADARWLNGKRLIAACKGVDLATGLGPTGVIRAACADALPAILTGPSFATDIAAGLPTALTLACEDDTAGAEMQAGLSTPSLRLYRITDTIGAELGGALKNVIAIASGVVIGAGLGHSARAAVMTRGFAEMQRLALHMGARRETLAGLSGFGDLVLTCTSVQSRNFRFGQALGAGQPFEAGLTVEGVATATATVMLARRHGLEMPLAETVSALTNGNLSLQTAVQGLMSRPLKQE